MLSIHVDSSSFDCRSRSGATPTSRYGTCLSTRKNFRFALRSQLILTIRCRPPFMAGSNASWISWPEDWSAAGTMLPFSRTREARPQVSSWAMGCRLTPVPAQGRKSWSKSAADCGADAETLTSYTVSAGWRRCSQYCPTDALQWFRAISAIQFRGEVSRLRRSWQDDRSDLRDVQPACTQAVRKASGDGTLCSMVPTCRSTVSTTRSAPMPLSFFSEDWSGSRELIRLSRLRVAPDGGSSSRGIW